MMEEVWEVFRFLFFFWGNNHFFCHCVFLQGLYYCLEYWKDILTRENNKKTRRDENCKLTNAEVKDVSSVHYAEIINDKSM